MGVLLLVKTRKQMFILIRMLFKNVYDGKTKIYKDCTNHFELIQATFFARQLCPLTSCDHVTKGRGHDMPAKAICTGRAAQLRTAFFKRNQIPVASRKLIWRLSQSVMKYCKGSRRGSTDRGHF